MIRACPKGLGSPVFDKLEAELAKALMSLPASKASLHGPTYSANFMLFQCMACQETGSHTHTHTERLSDEVFVDVAVPCRALRLAAASLDPACWALSTTTNSTWRTATSEHALIGVTAC